MASDELHYEGPKIEKDGHGIRPSTPRPVPRPPKPLYVDSADGGAIERRVDQQRDALRRAAAHFDALINFVAGDGRDAEMARQRLAEALFWATRPLSG